MQGRIDMRMSILLVVSAAACGTTQRPAPPSKSYTEHLEAAAHHERKAASHDESAREAKAKAGSPSAYSCGEGVGVSGLNDQLTSGGERLTNWVPCWDREEERALSQRRAAAKEFAAAERERAAAAELSRAEAAACQGLPPRELDHSPFEHKKAISEVVPHRVGDEVRGVRVVFRQVPGLTTSFLERAINCHRARWELLGKPPTYLAEDPTLVDGAEVTVSRAAGGMIEVFIRTPSDPAGVVALGRARELLPPRSAER